MNNFERKLEEFKKGPQQRAFLIERADDSDDTIDTEARTVWLAFSSEEPYERWFGNEILGHDDGEVDLSRMAGAALLVGHNWDDHVGVVEEYRVDADRRGRALVRFGKSARASEIFDDVVDGIRRQVSVGYMVKEMKLVAERDEGPDDYRVTDWQPYEVSIVSVAADPSVGVGRHDEALQQIEKETKTEIDKPEQEIPKMDPKEKEIETPVNVEAERSAAEANENNRVQEILAAGEKFGAMDLALNFVKDRSKSVDDLALAILEKDGVEAQKAEDPEIGMDERDLNNFSFIRLLNAAANPTDNAAQKAAGFELECSRAAAEKMRKDVRGIMVPYDVLAQKRDLTVAGEAANLVSTDLLSGSFIDLLTNMLAIRQCGATVLDGLNGNLAIPRQLTGTSHFWVGEGVAPTESDVTFDQVALTPHTVGAFTEFTRRTLKQSSIAVENFIRMDLARTLALAIDAAAINGSGTGDEPEGILNATGVGNSAVGGTNGGAPTWPHITKMESDVAAANADMGTLCYLTNALVRGKLKETEKFAASGREIWTGDANPLNGYRAVVSNQVPSDLSKGTSNGILSAMIFGNFADVLIGMWGGLDLLTNPYSKDTSGVVRVTAFQDVDVALRHEESFSVFNDIDPA